jgi:chorismate mutase
MFSHKPFLIAGPCSAESEEQMMQIAGAFRENDKVNMIRAGVWKPRSKPGQFEGKGHEALKWLQEVKRISGKKVCTEVATPEQIELALQFDIDAFWIGARSTVNPFTVQEIADALKGTNKPILIKNPINPDVELWAGAIERIQRSGISDIACIHRGFSSYDKSSKYRNKPNWAIPIEIKRRFPEIPIYCDISHICGNRTLLSEIAQRALDLDLDGLMVETHPNPDEALSDSKQQITPETLNDLIAGLQIRKGITNDTAAAKIEHLRQIMDSMDAEIIDLLAKRKTLGEQLGEIKIENNMPIYQPERWREIIESRTEWGLENEFTENFIRRIFEIIHEDSIKRQMEQLTAKGGSVI